MTRSTKSRAKPNSPQPESVGGSKTAGNPASGQADATLALLPAKRSSGEASSGAMDEGTISGRGAGAGSKSKSLTFPTTLNSAAYHFSFTFHAQTF